MFFKTRARLDEDRISQLESRVRTLEASLKAVDAEWTEMYDKFRRLHMRLSKRDQREQPAPQVAPGQTNGDPVGPLPASMNPLALNLIRGHE
jgi:hypothetical protein